MLSAPAHMPAIRVVSFGDGLAEPDLIFGAGMQTLSANSSDSPVWAASVITGTSPAHDTRWASSKTADDAVNLWDTFTGSAFLAGIDCCVENTNRSSSEGTFLITTLGQPANSSVDSG